MKFIIKYLNYKSLTVLFLVSSLVGSVYLVKLEQDNRGKAVGSGECACKDASTGATTSGTCKPDGGCICPAGTNPGTNKCEVKPPPQADDKCQAEQTICQENDSGKNTGFLCKCITDLDPNDWQCTTVDTKTCPTESGDTDGTAGQCGGAKARIVGRCIVAEPGYKLPLVVKYTCPGKMDMAGGCQENPKVVQAGSSSVCFDSNFCGVQQIDTENYSDCFMSVIDYNCTTPTKKPPTSTPPKSTLTPTQTPTSTPTVTLTLTPTQTPTGTLVPTDTPTITLTPTQTPTGTLAPSNTPTGTPAPTNTSGPSPTRIILPNAGVEFPAQALTVVGVIVTLFGFLILL